MHFTVLHKAPYCFMMASIVGEFFFRANILLITSVMIITFNAPDRPRQLEHIAVHQSQSQGLLYHDVKSAANQENKALVGMLVHALGQ